MNTPTPVCKGLTFWPIPEFSDPELAFGAQESAYFKRNDRPEVPREYENKVNDLFFSGGALDGLAPAVNHAKAMRAIRAWLTSWAPSHESKVSTAAYALWLWSTPEALKEAA